MLIDSFGDLNRYLVSRTVFIEPETERQCYYRSKHFLGLLGKKYETPSNCLIVLRSIRFPKMVDLSEILSLAFHPTLEHGVFP